MKQKYLSFLPALALIFSCLSMPVFSEDVVLESVQPMQATHACGGYWEMEEVVVDIAPPIEDNTHKISSYNSTSALDKDALMQYMYEEILKGNDEIVISSFRCSYDEISHVVEYLNYQYPCAFIDISKQYSVERVLGTNYVYSVTLPNLFSAEERVLAKQQIDNEIAEILSLVDETMSDMEKVLLVHDEVANRIVYDDLGAGNATDVVCHTVYGALVENSAVCQGYVAALSMLFTELDIPHLPCCSTQAKHIWNIVQLDGNWYHLDATFDDPTDYDIIHRYFLTTTDTQISFKGCNDFHAFGSTELIPVCDNSKYESGYIFNSTDGRIVKDNDKYLLESPIVENGTLMKWNYLSDTLREPHTLLAQLEVDTTTTFSNMLLRMKNLKELNNAYFYIAYYDASGILTKTQIQAVPASKSKEGYFHFYFTVDEQAIKKGSAKLFLWNGTTLQPFGSTAREAELIQ